MSIFLEKSEVFSGKYTKSHAKAQRAQRFLSTNYTNIHEQIKNNYMIVYFAPKIDV